MRRFFSWLAIGLTVVTLNLGCMGLVNDLTGLDIELAMGENAVHPADFPVRPPTSGTPSMSMAMTAEADNLNLPDDAKIELPPGTFYRMELIAYEHDDPTGEFEAATKTLADAGWTPAPQDETPELRLYTKDGAFFALIASDDPAGSSWSLMRLKPVTPDAAAP